MTTTITTACSQTIYLGTKLVEVRVKEYWSDETLINIQEEDKLQSPEEAGVNRVFVCRTS